jgi:hypothetical protein
MKLIIGVVLTILVGYSFVSYSQQKTLQLKVRNPHNFLINDAYLELSVDDLADSFIIKDGNDLIPYQIEQKESGGKKICLVLNLKPNEEKVLSLMYGDEIKKPEFKSRTYAELAMKPGNIYHDGKFRGNSFVNVTKIKVPLIHTDHDALFKYEGPGWESEKVGYRFYLDWRNATDIFGKKKDQLILANVGVHDTVAKDDSYHSMQDWGMDIFKVGNSLGIGSIGMWYDGKVKMVSKTDSIYFEITQNGPIKSEVKTNYFGWNIGGKKFDLESKLSITAGSLLTKSEINISNEPSNIVTGLAKFPGTNFLKNEVAGEWSFIALYGNQTLVSDNDKLGIAVFYRTRDLEELTEDELSYVIKLKPVNGKINYYFCAAWEQQQNGIENSDEFKKYLNETQMLLNNPLTISLKQKGD